MESTAALPGGVHGIPDPFSLPFHIPRDRIPADRVQAIDLWHGNGVFQAVGQTPVRQWDGVPHGLRQSVDLNAILVGIGIRRHGRAALTGKKSPNHKYRHRILAQKADSFQHGTVKFWCEDRKLGGELKMKGSAHSTAHSTKSLIIITKKLCLLKKKKQSTRLNAVFFVAFSN